MKIVEFDGKDWYELENTNWNPKEFMQNADCLINFLRENYKLPANTEIIYDSNSKKIITNSKKVAEMHSFLLEEDNF